MERNTIRLMMGLNQLKFAYLLGVSESTVAMYETRQRDLPTQALLKLGKLSVALNALKPSLKPLPSDKPIEGILQHFAEKNHGPYCLRALNARWKRRLKILNLEVQKLEMDAENLQENLEAAWQSAQVVEHLLNDPTTELDKKVLDLAHRTRLSTIDELAEKWVALKTKRQVLEAEKKGLEDFARELGSVV